MKQRSPRAGFDADAGDGDNAASFYKQWQRRLFDGDTDAASDGGFIYVPLQGRLLQKRSFQQANPVDMIAATLEQDPVRDVVLTLHPNETYSPEERAALDAMIAAHPRLSLVTDDAQTLIRTCNYIVTQNSSAAIKGFFYGKNAVLFGQVDFHHIAANVATLGVSGAFEKAQNDRPDFARYLYWFLQLNAINAGRADAESRILSRMERHGWQM